MNRLRGIGIAIVISCMVVVCYVLFLSPQGTQHKEANNSPMPIGDRNHATSHQESQDINNDRKKDTGTSVSEVDPIALYHEQVRSHAVGNRFAGILSLYRESGDISLLSVLIEVGLEAGEYDVLREELSNLAIDSKEVAGSIGAEYIIKTLFTITPLTIKSYEPLKNVVNRYHDSELITSSQKDSYYSLIALAKGHADDYEYFVESSGDQDAIKLVERVRQSQEQYTYAPDWWSLGLYGIAAYESGWYRVSENIAQILKTNDPGYLLGHQLELRSSLKLHQRERVESSSQGLMALDATLENHDAYRFTEAIAVYKLGDYARSVILFGQLENTDYANEAMRYKFLIALDNQEDIIPYVQAFEKQVMHISDYYALMSILYPPYPKQPSETIRAIDRIIKKCQGAIEDGYTYICLMGKAGSLWNAGESRKATLILEQLTQTYPTTEIRELLGEIYGYVGNKSDAKKAYIQALRFDADDQGLEERVLPRIEAIR